MSGTNNKSDSVVSSGQPMEFSDTEQYSQNSLTGKRNTPYWSQPTCTVQVKNGMETMQNNYLYYEL